LADECHICGHAQREDARSCGQSGATLLIEPGDATGEITGPIAVADLVEEGLLPAGARVEGPALVQRSSGQIFPLTSGPVNIGRSEASDIFLDDVTVSRNHACIVRSYDGLILRDLGSLNGTYVNRRRIEADEPLRQGDELQVGKFRLTFVAG